MGYVLSQNSPPFLGSLLSIGYTENWVTVPITLTMRCTELLELALQGIEKNSELWPREAPRINAVFRAQWVILVRVIRQKRG